MTLRDSLAEMMHLPDETVQRIHDSGFAIASVDTMSQAIHDVYCGITADHDHPNAKDQAQAQALLDRIRRYASLAE